MRRLPPSILLLRIFLISVGRIFTPLFLGLLLARWPIRPERDRFRGNLTNSAIRMPPFFRGLVAVSSTQFWLQVAASHVFHLRRGSLEHGGPPDLGGNLYTAWKGPAVGFLHFEKCGGIAMMHWLSQKFHPEQINPDPWRDLPSNFYWRSPPSLPDTMTGRFPLVWGHYDLPTLRRIAPGRFVFTLLREPRARLLSLYRFWRSVDPAQLDLDLSFSVAMAHRLSLEDFLACDDPMLIDLIDNLYVRRLTGLYAAGAPADPLARAPEAALADSAEALRSLGYVGITERLDASALGLAARLGVPPPPPGLRANVAAENHADPSGWFRRSHSGELSPAAERALDRRTVLDRVLYARLLAGFERPAGEDELICDC